MPKTNRKRTWILLAIVLPVGLIVAIGGIGVWWAFTVTPGTADEELSKLESYATTLSGDEETGRKKWDELQAIIAAWETAEHQTAQYISQPPDWPAGITFPHDFDKGVMDGLPACVKETHSMFAKGAQASGLVAQIEAFGAPPTFIRPFTRDAKDLTEILLPDIDRSRQIHSLLVLNLRVAAESGDASLVPQLVRASMGFSGQVGRDPVLISYLNAQAMRTNTLHEIRRLVGEHRMPTGALKPLLETLSATTMLDPAIGLEGERLFTISMLRRTHTDRGNGDGIYLPHECATLFAKWNPGTPIPSRLSNLQGWLAPSLAATQAHANDIYDRLIASTKISPIARTTTVEPAIDPATSAFPVLTMILPALSHVVNSHDMARLEFASTRLMLALELHIAAHGSPPLSLAELHPAIMSVLPEDPWNGVAWGYRPLEPGARPDGWTYLLYSRGKDGIDHGGIANTNPPGAMAQSGKDWIVNLSRENWK
jgi:hypothetical protein